VVAKSVKQLLTYWKTRVWIFSRRSKQILYT